MKKMMLAAATLAAGVAMADIVSSDIVGYTQKTLADDSQAISIGFTEVGGSGFNLTSLQLEATSSGDICIEVLNSQGRTIATYSWYKDAFGRDDGWYNDDDDLIGVDVADVTFNPGDGLWLTGIDGEMLTTAGKVFQADLSLDLHDDCQMLGNPYAAPIGLAENIDVDVAASSGDIAIEMLNSAGRTIATYSFYKNAFGKDDGWYNDDDDLVGDDVADVTFLSGQGLWVTGMDDTKFNITSPIPAN